MSTTSHTPLTFRIFQGDSLVGEQTLSLPVIKIGKLSSSHLRIDDADISRMHAVIERSPTGELHIIDLGSTRGTFVNGQKVNKAVVRAGDRVELGNTRIELAAPSNSQVPVVRRAPVTARANSPAAPAMPAAPAIPAAPTVAASATRVAAPVNAPAVFSVFADEARASVSERAIEVAAMMDDSVVGVVHLSDPHAGRVSRLTKVVFACSAAMLITAGVAFAAGVENAAHNEESKEAWATENRPAYDWRPRLISPAFDWMAFGGLGLGLFGLTWGAWRLRGERKSPFYRIGSAPEVEFPTSAAPSESFPLVAPRGQDFVFSFTAGMDGDLAVDGARTPLADLISSGRARASEAAPGAFEMAIPERARIKVGAGQNTFLISSVSRPKRQAVPVFGAVENRALAFFAGSAIVHLSLWMMLRTIPPSPATLTLDLGGADARISRITSKANEDRPQEIQPAEENGTDGGSSGASMALESGKMGDKKSDRTAGRYQMKKNGDTQQLSREQVEAQAREAGVLGVMHRQRSFAALTGTGDFSSGLDDANIFGGMLGDEAGAMNGGFGFGPSGFGPGGGGTSWGTIGAGSYGTIGHNIGTGTGYDPGSGGGLPTRRHGNPPTVAIGEVVQSGGLDKSTIRRYIRQRIERIKYCYEKPLLSNPALAGTVVVDFQISPQGSVLSAKAQGVGEEVSSCVAEVVSSIQFPKPNNNMIVQVKYPFTFRPSGR